ncbi:uncharacterized protein SOCE26_080840 [Sorangium cellulosum]|uniref:Uncharacterized protein n=1 Tax=Sorangium cellulosum TaxID=56 RepID=A0A2L0F4Q3_SORCE|nr:hypothetical protein [Sorangium cellulosum]AUX46578.1 uncharacterized protein SOCE26_080840 [Sorangium cellulosum]
MDPALLRFLDLVQRELSADDALIELGGRPSDDPRTSWCTLPNGSRLVARFAEPPGEPAKVAERLAELAATFAGVSLHDAAPRPSPGASTHRLDDELEGLALRAGALGAVVVDDTSPVVWGTSEPRRDEVDVEDAVLLARWADEVERAGVNLIDLLELDDAALEQALATTSLGARERENVAGHLQKIRERGSRSPAAWRRQVAIARAIDRVRGPAASEGSAHGRFIGQDDQVGVYARSFANIYRVILAYPGPFSELQAEGAVQQALPQIERLVLALPPIDPHPGAKILRLKRPT